ncbi:hypothetical protein SAMN05428959_101148 [Duganella sp. CF517]|uniref:catalase family protein n=1 Tax=Duganella sp. CF517 TaxID=1881038 RepID=UPI0008D6900E|nr:catalase family protein [Duganella sp. CF517]SEN09124.1 hypothetical protein SAMN05428959_101148 [Duganella sp. CF517]
MTPLLFTPDVEVIDDDEQQLIASIVEQMAASSRCAFERHRHAIRDAHAKSNGLLTGELVVHDNLPPELRQGVFATPRTYAIVARLSSAPSDIHSDEIPAARGFAFKIIGVDGARLAPDIAGHNQDFLMVNFPALAFGTLPKYKRMLGLLEANAAAPDAFQRLVAGTAHGAKQVLEGLGGTPGATLDGLARDNHHPLGETYHTQAALRYGDHIAKLSLAPASAEVRALSGRDVDDIGYAGMRDAIGAHFAGAGAEYTLSAQLCVDLQRMPVEDAAIAWPEELSPHRPVATLRFAPQSTAHPARQVYGDDSLSFNPWNGVAAHQPLGAIMRVRRVAYERSTAFRHAMNARPRVEPTQASDIPD